MHKIEDLDMFLQGIATHKSLIKLVDSVDEQTRSRIKYELEGVMEHPQYYPYAIMSAIANINDREYENIRDSQDRETQDLLVYLESTIPMNYTDYIIFIILLQAPGDFEYNINEYTAALKNTKNQPGIYYLTKLTEMIYKEM